MGFELAHSPCVEDYNSVREEVRLKKRDRVPLNVRGACIATQIATLYAALHVPQQSL